METVIRPARATDLDAMTELLRRLFSIESDFAFDQARQAAGLSLLLASGKDLVLVAECRNRVVGMCSVQTLISTAEGGRVGLMEDLVVAEDHAGRGIGRKLLEGIETWAVQQRLSRLQLLADIDNQPALAFYEHLDWKKTRLAALRKFPGTG